MGASGKTSNLQLPIYIGQDQPLYIPTFNDAMQKIDAGWATNKTAIENTITALGQTNENVTAVDAKAQQALQTANNALNRLVDINNITFTFTNGFTIKENDVKVVNGILCGHFVADRTDNATTSVTCNYVISGRIIGAIYNGQNTLPYTLAFSNGQSNVAVECSRIEFFFNIPWNSSWVTR